MIKVKISTGFECEVNEHIGNDWRVTKAMAALDKKQDDFGQVSALVDLVELILGHDTEVALCSHLEQEYGYVPTDKIEEAVAEIFKALAETEPGKNL